jgi:4-methylaminobutanoate oxidase (formaldehyde-forming)
LFHTHPQVLSPFGTLEADLTITKLPPGSLGSHRNSPAFMVVATDTQQRHVERLLQDAVGEDQAASVTDITGAYAQINLQGPRSRESHREVT